MFRTLTPLLSWLILVGSTTSLAAGESSPVPQMLQTLKPRSIGPANMSGRITEVAVYEKEPRIMYVASASGGLWKTVNNGTTWKVVFDKESTIALGAVAVAATNPDIVWVGTGEANARNSVSWGDGVYKSTDGGKTWQHMGLKDSQHIGRIVVHPVNPDIVYVAALGRLWGPNDERGLFKTTNGGQTWECVKLLDENTGFIDLVVDPSDPDRLYAAAYQVRRDAFSGGNPAVQTGPHAGLYKTTDGGKTWSKMTHGLPDRPFGRCGLSVYRRDPKVVYAVVQTDKTNATTQGQQADRKLVLQAGGIFRSDDYGETWTHLNLLCPRPFYYGQIRVDPNDDQRIYVLGIQFHISNDGGKNFLKGNGAPGTHVDYHALWIDPRDSKHLVLGCDGGLHFSYDRSVTWEHLKNLPVSQFYAIGLDSRKPYRVYGGLQDNGSWGGPSATKDAAGIALHEWFNILGFDGYYCQIDPDDPDTVYCEGQYGILRRVNVRTSGTSDIKPRLDGKDAKTNITPAPPAKSPAFRFNWSSPILMSPHNPKTIYYGANVLFRSENRGDAWQVISPDLTRGKPGPSEYNGHTITTIAESPQRKGLLYVGTDDGKIHIGRKGGKEWQDLSDKVPGPQARWITRLECSNFSEGTVYLTIDRHRNDDRASHVFKSIDNGETWGSLAKGLTDAGPVHVIREDPRNPEVLYLGAEYGLFISLDAGATWHKQRHLPTVPVHDLVVHGRDRELAIATHGRGIYIVDVLPLQELAGKDLKSPRFLPVRPAEAYRPRTWKNQGSKQFNGENPPLGAGFHVFLPQEGEGLLTIADRSGNQLAELKVKGVGLQRLSWRLMQPKTPQGVFRPVPAGEYTARLRVGQQALDQRFQVEVEE